MQRDRSRKIGAKHTYTYTHTIFTRFKDEKSVRKVERRAREQTSLRETKYRKYRAPPGSLLRRAA